MKTYCANIMVNKKRGTLYVRVANDLARRV